MQPTLAKIFGGALVLALCSAVAGCGNKQTPDGGPIIVDAGPGFDLGTVSFAQIETQVFVAHCGSGGMGGRTCHERKPPEGGMDLTLGNAFVNLVNVPAYISPAKMRVLPGDPNNSFLYQKMIDKLGPLEGNPMPFQTGGKAAPVAADLLAMVRVWIAQGAQNN